MDCHHFVASLLRVAAPTFVPAQPNALRSVCSQADEDPALFWRFIEEWQQGLPGLGSSPQQCWAGIRAAAAAHLSPTMARLFDASLAARQYSARLQAFHQLAEDSSAELAAAAAAGSRPCCWALLGGRAYTEAHQLREAVHAALATEARAAEGTAGAVYPFDHVYASSAAAAAPPLNISAPATVPVELFAPIGSRCGAQLHEVLADAAARSDAAAAAAAATGGPPMARLAYAWRPLLEPAACGDGEVHACTLLGTGGQLVLPGYGVELALKNMEYNAQDDKKDVRAGCQGGPLLPDGPPCQTPLALLATPSAGSDCAQSSKG